MTVSLLLLEYCTLVGIALFKAAARVASKALMGYVMNEFIIANN